MPLLDVHNLSAGYQNGNVIEDISFSLQPGEFVSILGRNGAGKSTLIKALQGLLKKVEGMVEVESESVFSMPSQKLAKRIAYVPQISSLSFQFSVEEIIQMGRYVHQRRLAGPSTDDQDTVQEVIELTGIGHLRKNKIAHLSGGEQQRVFIARALAQNTPLLFLDEPSSHLDISYQIEIYRILKRLQLEKGKTILSTEHNINLAIPYSQRLMLLKEGRIYAQGCPEKLITKACIREVFGADVDIRDNIHSGLPEISLIPQAEEKP
jgi:iron complex transport system ATP-binding protein